MAKKKPARPPASVQVERTRCLRVRLEALLKAVDTLYDELPRTSLECVTPRTQQRMDAAIDAARLALDPVVGVDGSEEIL